LSVSSGPKSNDVWAFYCKCLEEKPILTKCITSGFLSFTADVVCQVYFTPPKLKSEKKTNDVDWLRTMKFTAIGTFFVGPILHYWYGFLATNITATGWIGTIQRLAFDQLGFAPIFIPMFFSVLLTLDGRPEQIPETLRREWLPTVLANYSVWVPAMIINFRFIPPTHQVLFSNLVGFGWNIYMSYQSFKAQAASITDAKILPVRLNDLQLSDENKK
jgi:hypothetical protein